jgi:hypothetical protein
MSRPDDCNHAESLNPRRAGDCVKCGYPLPPWYLTEAYARQVYEAIGISDLADHAVGRLRVGGRDYAWTAYLDRENSPEGVDELVDAIHYTIFETLRTYKLEAEGLVSSEQGDTARTHLARGAMIAADFIREFQLAATALKE